MNLIQVVLDIRRALAFPLLLTLLSYSTSMAWSAQSFHDLIRIQPQLATYLQESEDWPMKTLEREYSKQFTEDACTDLFDASILHIKPHLDILGMSLKNKVNSSLIETTAILQASFPEGFGKAFVDFLEIKGLKTRQNISPNDLGNLVQGHHLHLYFEEFPTYCDSSSGLSPSDYDTAFGTLARLERTGSGMNWYSSDFALESPPGGFDLGDPFTFDDSDQKYGIAGPAWKERVQLALESIYPALKNLYRKDPSLLLNEIRLECGIRLMDKDSLKTLGVSGCEEIPESSNLTSDQISQLTMLRLKLLQLAYYEGFKTHWDDGKKIDLGERISKIQSIYPNLQDPFIIDPQFLCQRYVTTFKAQLKAYTHELSTATYLSEPMLLNFFSKIYVPEKKASLDRIMTEANQGIEELATLFGLRVPSEKLEEVHKISLKWPESLTDLVLEKKPEFPFLVANLSRSRISSSYYYDLPRAKEGLPGEAFNAEYSFPSINESHDGYGHVWRRFDHSISFGFGFLPMVDSHSIGAYFIIAHELGHKIAFEFERLGRPLTDSPFGKYLEVLRTTIDVRPDQIEETFADWIAVQATREQIGKLPPEKRKAAVYEVSAFLYSAYLPLYDGMSAGGSLLEALAQYEASDPHLDLKHRINLILGADPKIRDFLGCKN
jgi:hypothetical protein